MVFPRENQPLRSWLISGVALRRRRRVVRGQPGSGARDGRRQRLEAGDTLRGSDKEGVKPLEKLKLHLGFGDERRTGRNLSPDLYTCILPSHSKFREPAGLM